MQLAMAREAAHTFFLCELYFSVINKNSKEAVLNCAVFASKVDTKEVVKKEYADVFVYARACSGALKTPRTSHLCLGASSLLRSAVPLRHVCTCLNSVYCGYTLAWKDLHLPRIA